MEAYISIMVLVLLVIFVTNISDGKRGGNPVCMAKVKLSEPIQFLYSALPRVNKVTGPTSRRAAQSYHTHQMTSRGWRNHSFTDDAYRPPYPEIRRLWTGVSTTCPNLIIIVGCLAFVFLTLLYVPCSVSIVAKDHNFFNANRVQFCSIITLAPLRVKVLQFLTIFFYWVIAKNTF